MLCFMFIWFPINIYIYIFFYIKVNDMWIKELPENTYLFGIK